MISNEQMRDKIKRFRRRSSRKRLEYFVNSYGADHVIWRSLCALHTQVRIQKENQRYINANDMVWLLAIKQYLVESGQDKFHMREVKRFLNFHFKQNKSSLSAIVVRNNLVRGGYIVREGITKMSKYMLTMKARAFYVDLYELLSI